MKKPYGILISSLVTSTLLVLLGAIGAFAAPPTIPSTNAVVRYEREQPVFQSKAISRDLGDTLLSALDDGRQIQEWRLPPGITEAIPVPAHHWLGVVLTNGTVYRIGISFDGGTIYLPEGLYDVKEAAQSKVATIATRLHSRHGR